MESRSRKRNQFLFFSPVGWVVILIITLMLFFGRNIIVPLFTPALWVAEKITHATSMASYATWSKQELMVALYTMTYRDESAHSVINDTQPGGRVVFSSRATYNGTLVIRHIIPPQVGDYVITDDSFVALGQVHEVRGNYSYITLFSKAGEYHAIRFGDYETVFPIRGTGGGSFVIELPREFTLEPETFVYSAEIPDTIIGRVARVDFDPRDPFQTIYVRSAVNTHMLDSVIFISSPESSQ